MSRSSALICDGCNASITNGDSPLYPEDWASVSFFGEAEHVGTITTFDLCQSCKKPFVNLLKPYIADRKGKK